jgi:hypothetical protein
MKTTETQKLQFFKAPLLQKLFFSLFFFSSSTFAEQNFVDIGYMPATSSLTESINFGVYGLKENNTLYINFNLGLKPYDSSSYSSYYYDTISDIKQVPFSINVGRTFPIVPDSANVPIYKSIHGYFGLGYASLSGIAKYTYSGYNYGYYEYPSKDKNGLNLNGGLIFLFDSLGVNIGVNSFTKSAYINIGLMID